MTLTRAGVRDVAAWIWYTTDDTVHMYTISCVVPRCKYTVTDCECDCAERRVLGSAGRSLALSRRLVVRCPCRPCAVCLAVAVSVRFLSVACGGGSCVLVVSGVSVVLLRVRPCPSVSVRVAPAPSRHRFCFPVMAT